MAGPVRLADRLVLEASPERVRRLLDDVPAVIACIPGASATGAPVDGAYPATIGVQYGETGIRFAGTVRLAWEGARLDVSAEGQDARGTVRAQGTIRLVLHEDEAARVPVDLEAEFSFSGILAPLARSATGIVGPQLLKSFGRCLASKLAATA